MYAIAFIIAGILIGIVCKIIAGYFRDCEKYLYGDDDDNSGNDTNNSKNKKN